MLITTAGEPLAQGRLSAGYFLIENMLDPTPDLVADRALVAKLPDGLALRGEHIAAEALVEADVRRRGVLQGEPGVLAATRLVGERCSPIMVSPMRTT